MSNNVVFIQMLESNEFTSTFSCLLFNCHICQSFCALHIAFISIILLIRAYDPSLQLTYGVLPGA
jgi:hypothetical protein